MNKYIFIIIDDGFRIIPTLLALIHSACSVFTQRGTREGAWWPEDPILEHQAVGRHLQITERVAQAHRRPGPAAFSASWLISNWSLLVSGRRGELRACECIRHGVKHGELCWALCVDLV